jgi:hypothetical protein
MLIVGVMLYVIMLSDVMLNVVAPIDKVTKLVQPFVGLPVI